MRLGAKVTGSWGPGLVAAAAMLLWMLAARLWLRVLSPIELLADWIIPRIPLSWFEMGLSLLGGYAKPLLYLLGLGATLLLGALLGVAYSRLQYQLSMRARSRLAEALVVALLLFTGLVLLPLTGQGIFGVASSAGMLRTLAYYLPAYLIFAAVLVLAHPLPAGDADPGRRRVLRCGLQGGGALLLLAAAGPVLGRLLSRMTLTSVTANAEGMPAPVTPVGTFYNVSKNALDPRVDAAKWRLNVGGMVQSPFALSLDEIRALPSIEKMHTLQCISNPIGGNLIGNAEWQGFPLRDLLQRAGVQQGVVDIKLTSEDGYTESIPLPKAMEPGTLLVYDMNGEPLTYKHGAPLRLLVPNIYGMKNAKWITSIEAVAEDFKGYWQRQGWSDVAIYQTMSQLRAPSTQTRVVEGQSTEVGGIAFAGSRGIQKVEWSADGGRSWREAELLPELTEVDTWRFWQAEWSPEQAGNATLMVRATDGEGRTQTDEQNPTLPDGATGYHSLEVRVTAREPATGG